MKQPKAIIILILNALVCVCTNLTHQTLPWTLSGVWPHHEGWLHGTMGNQIAQTGLERLALGWVEAAVEYREQTEVVEELY